MRHCQLDSAYSFGIYVRLTRLEVGGIGREILFLLTDGGLVIE
jgi:hypothetical protein